MAKYIKLDTTVQNLEFDKSWKLLSTKEQNYAYYLYKASWAGAKMVFNQISYESPALFVIFQLYFQSKDFQALQEVAHINAGITEEEWAKFIAYVSGFYSNMGNYHAFGHSKFVPELSQEKFKAILFSNPLMKDTSSSFYKDYLEKLYPLVEREIFELEAPFSQLGFPEEGGVTGYFSPSMTSADLTLIREFFAEKKLSPLNTRAFKISHGEQGHVYDITVGSIEQKTEEHEFKGQKIRLIFGEFAPFLVELNYYLEKAKNYVANDNQKEMIEHYIDHFRTGSIDAHKDSQRKWIRDKGPVVESNLGWIEVYIDPENIRAYFEGWVAIVDKAKSEKFKKLVENSEQVIPLLPWPKEMEKDSFLAPDFTTLEVIAFATDSCPLGINIPNYDDIRDNEGFKNVFLGNSAKSYAISAMQFATPDQMKVLSENTQRCYEVHVACHELLGHGVGKLIYRAADGSIPHKFKDPISGEEFESCYEQGEDWNGKFGPISTSYEECRADTCGFYLCTLKEVHTLFGFNGDDEEEIKTLLWTNVMNQFRKGILGLQLFNVANQKWGQAHTWGAYVFSQYLYQNQKGGPSEGKLIQFEVLKDEQNFFIHLDKEQLWGEGRELIRQFLNILQAYKSTGCIERASKFWAHYSKVDGLFLDIRDIVIDKKKPRRIELNNNLIRYNEGAIEPILYPERMEAIIHSYADRYPINKALADQVLGVWDAHREYLRVPLK